MPERLFGNPSLEAMELFPLHYPWAYAHVQQGKHNTWFPEEIPLGDDLADWNSKLTEEEKRAVQILLGFFNPMESLVTQNIMLAIFPYVRAPEARLYLARQAWEEANHTMAFEYLLKTYPVDPSKVFAVHANVAAVQAKEAFQQELTRQMVTRIDFDTPEGKERLLKDLVGYFVVLEGVFFYSGFLFALSFRRQNKLKGFAQIIDWVLKDESLHLSFGINLINTFLSEFPEVMTPKLGQEIKSLITKAVELESAYNHTLLPEPLIGVSAEVLNQYTRYVADRRLEELGFEPEYNVANPAKWMATEVDIPEIVNFFEAQNTSYEVASRRE
jgi:ribonucleoside-diphosphate reductase beta chain